MANEVFGYRKLIAYQKGKEVVKRTYHILKKFPAEERYAMCDQLRRASVLMLSRYALSSAIETESAAGLMQ